MLNESLKLILPRYTVGSELDAQMENGAALPGCYEVLCEQHDAGVAYQVLVEGADGPFTLGLCTAAGEVLDAVMESARACN